MSHDTKGAAIPMVGRMLLIAALSLAALPRLFDMPITLQVLITSVVIWRVFSDLHGWQLPSRTIRFGILFIASLLMFYHFRTIAGREAGSAFLTMLLILKLLEMRNLRDAMITIFLGYFLVAAAFLGSQSILMGVYLFITVTALTVAMVSINHQAAHWSEAIHYFRSAATMLIQATPIMVLLFLLYPRIPGPLWALPSGVDRAKSGLSDTLSPGNISYLADSDEVAFRAEFSGPIPNAADLYWRGLVLWNSNGKTWRPLHTYQRLLSGMDERTFQGIGNTTEYQITLQPHGRRWLFALDLPTTIPDIPNDAELINGFQLLAKRSIDDTIRYRASSYLRYSTPELTMWQRRITTSLPAEANPETRALAKSWLRQGLGDAQLVERAIDHFRSKPFYYTRQPPLLLGEHSVDQFLFDSRRGFCGHFSSAFVTLMRAADVPARIVTGYQGGELNPVGNYIIVRQSDAHAWAEVWLQGRGWTRIDPTAVIPEERVVSNVDTTRFTSTGADLLTGDQINWLRKGWLGVRRGWDAVNYGWSRWVVGFDTDRQEQLLDRLGILKYGWSTIIAIMTAIGAILLTLLTLISLQRSREQQDRVVKYYRQFCNKLAKSGVVRGAAEGPLDFANRASEQLPRHSASILSTTQLYLQIRYGDSDNRDRLSQFRHMVSKLSLRPNS